MLAKPKYSQNRKFSEWISLKKKVLWSRNISCFTEMCFEAFDLNSSSFPQQNGTANKTRFLQFCQFEKEGFVEWKISNSVKCLSKH